MGWQPGTGTDAASTWDATDAGSAPAATDAGLAPAASSPATNAVSSMDNEPAGGYART